MKRRPLFEKITKVFFHILQNHPDENNENVKTISFWNTLNFKK